MNIEYFTQYIFSRIWQRALDAQKFGVSEEITHNRTNRINWYVRENLATGRCLVRLDAQKFSSAKISTFTVLSYQGKAFFQKKGKY